MFFWSPFLTGRKVEVKAEDGIVTLDGEVDTWLEFFQAEKIAFKAGARDVRNHLEITNLSLHYTPEDRALMGMEDL